VTVACDNAPAFVRAAVGLAGDPAWRREMGVHARDTACELSWDHIVERFEDVLVNASQQVQLVRRALPVGAALQHPAI
jgi:hypothetical protein